MNYVYILHTHIICWLYQELVTKQKTNSHQLWLRELLSIHYELHIAVDYENKKKMYEVKR